MKDKTGLFLREAGKLLVKVEDGTITQQHLAAKLRLMFWQGYVEAMEENSFEHEGTAYIRGMPMKTALSNAMNTLAKSL